MVVDNADVECLLPESKKHGKPVNEIVKHINGPNIKIFAVLLVSSFILYHGLLHTIYGMDSCTWLFSDGRVRGDMGWQPYGCMLHQYTKLDTNRCFKYLAFWGRMNHFVFMGDSRLRGLYQEFVKQFQPSIPGTSDISEKPIHSDLNFADASLKLVVEFIWSPFVSKRMTQHLMRWQNQGPSVIIMNSGSWAIKQSNGSVEVVNEYAANISRLVHLFDGLTNQKTRAIWLLQEPVNEEKLSPARMAITNMMIDRYNAAAMEVLQHSAVEVWSSSRLIAQVHMDEISDGIHLGPKTLSTDVQLLLNAYCDDHMNFDDGTCCSSSEPYTTLQVMTFSALFVCFLIGCTLAIRHTKYDYNSSGIYVITTSLAKLGLIMAYFYLCDRTNFFMKENKYYSPVSFWLPIAYVLALGLFFTEDSRYTKVLHKDQTDEWKGWMQFVILIYHFTGASKVLPIYNHIRVLVSAYLFLTGYGHFIYFWHRTDVGVVRFFQVLFRMNFMAVTLCFCMNRPYQFYYFVPLVSFWFSMLYLVLLTPPRVTAMSCEANPLHYLYLAIKIIVFFSLIVILYMSEVFFEKVFVTRPWKALFVTTDDDIHEWWFRWKLDRYSTAYGAVFALALMVAQRYNLVDDNNHSNLFSPRVAICLALTALAGIIANTIFTLLCSNKPECNEVHSYTVFVPIISYIALRNLSGILRTRYSSLFAWFGRISLELFIGQYHIWLAADSYGVLVIIPRYPVLNALVTLFIFVCASHEIHNITLKLLPFAVPYDWRLAVRNISIFLFILMPIAIYDGMF
nr:PREDICTED: CAS1 domain-containing protein 1 [Bemisia tabaci]